MRFLITLLMASVLVTCGPSRPNSVASCAGTLVPGYPETGIFFLHDYGPRPDSPPGPLTCFRSVRDARAAGLRPAPPPAGGILIGDGIYLVPSDESLLATCVRAAAVVGYAVPCPGLVPMHRAPVSCPMQDYAPNTGGKDCVENSGAGSAGGLLDTFTFGQSDMVLPDTYEGTGPAANHIWIIGVRADSRLAPIRSGCETAVTEILGPQVNDHPSAWLQCPDGHSLHSGHTILRWTDGPVIYVVSLHGYAAVNREIAQALANALVMVGR